MSSSARRSEAPLFFVHARTVERTGLGSEGCRGSPRFYRMARDDRRASGPKAASLPARLARDSRHVGKTPNPIGDRAVESHASQRTRSMGHPEVRLGARKAGPPAIEFLSLSLRVGFHGTTNSWLIAFTSKPLRVLFVRSIAQLVL